MIDRLKALFGGGPAAAAGASVNPGSDDLHLAAAALLVEAATMDGHFDPEERDAIRSALEDGFGLDADVLTRVLPKTGTLLEIGSGSGQHAVAFAPRFPGLCWQTSDPDPTARASIVAWMEVEQVDAPPPLAIDVEAETWPLARADAVVCINMIHIAPWSSCLGLMAGTGRVLREGGVLYLYGPYRIKGAHTAPSNEAFDQSLRERDPRWGVRDLGDVILAAARHDLAFVERVAMPTNNFSVVFHRSGR